MRIIAVMSKPANKKGTTFVLAMAAKMSIFPSSSEVQEPELRASVPNGARFRGLPERVFLDCELVDRKFCDFDGITSALADLDDPLCDDLSNRIVSIY
jgi:hypothetical protein